FAAPRPCASKSTWSSQAKGKRGTTRLPLNCRGTGGRQPIPRVRVCPVLGRALDAAADLIGDLVPAALFGVAAGGDAECSAAGGRALAVYLCVGAPVCWGVAAGCRACWFGGVPAAPAALRQNRLATRTITKSP